MNMGATVAVEIVMAADRTEIDPARLPGDPLRGTRTTVAEARRKLLRPG